MRDLTINAKDFTKIQNTTAAFTVQLLDNSTPLPNKALSITINGVKYDRTTNGTGHASLNINLPPGSYPTTVAFKGDATYNAANKVVIVRVLDNSTITQPQTKKANHYFEVNKMPLRVLMDDGFDTKMGTTIKETELLRDNLSLNAPTFFFNKGNHGLEFEISIVMREKYYFNNMPAADSLNQWSKWMIPVSVVTDAMDVPNGKYIMSIKGKKQTDKSKSIWKLRFKEYYENSLTFEENYTKKTASLSSVDQVLSQHRSISELSPKNQILALQMKLQELGYWTDTVYTYDKWGVRTVVLDDDAEPKRRVPNGIWDRDMQNDIFDFQCSVGLSSKNGKCDRDTITLLVGATYSDVQMGSVGDLL
jgi:hypothetical protein